MHVTYWLCILCAIGWASGVAQASHRCGLPLDLKPIGVDHEPGRFGVTLLLDRSTSMFQKARWKNAVKGLKNLAEWLKQLGIKEVYFQTIPAMDSPNTPGAEKCHDLAKQLLAPQHSSGSRTLNLRAARPCLIDVDELLKIPLILPKESEQDQGTPPYMRLSQTAWSR